MAAVFVTSLLRSRLRPGTWRAVHWLAYLCWPVAVAHTFGMGTDAGELWVIVLGAVSVAAVLAALIWRVAAVSRQRAARVGLRLGRRGAREAPGARRRRWRRRASWLASTRLSSLRSATGSSAIPPTWPVTRLPRLRFRCQPPRGRNGGRRSSGRIEASGLTGRGGAGFPAAIKVALARAAGHGGTILVNAMEGEPASDKDKLLLLRSPHLVLDGAQLLAAATGAAQVCVCVPAGREQVAAATAHALAERAAAGWAPVAERLVRPPDRFVAGEESALVGWVESGRSLPSFRPDKGRPLRLGRAPALIHNAETLAHVAMIARFGAEAFRRQGPADDPGTSLVTISGAVEQPGVVEVARGTALADIAARANPLGTPRAFLVGGYGGSWVGPAHFETPYASLPLRAIGASAGVGVLVVARPRSLRPHGVGTGGALPGPAELGPVRPLRVRLARHRRRHDPSGSGHGRPGSHGAPGAASRRCARPGRLSPSRRRRQPGAERARRVRSRRRGPRPWRAVPLLEPTHRACGSRTSTVDRERRARPRSIRWPAMPTAIAPSCFPKRSRSTSGGIPSSTGSHSRPSWLAAARRAARDCPRRAITVHERPGGR